MKNLIEENINLAFAFAHNFNKTHEWNSKFDYEDIISDCLYGLVKAAKHFNPSMGINFSTFAHICMKNEIMMSMRQKKKLNEHTFTLNLYDKEGDLLEDITLIFSENNGTPEEESLIDSLTIIHSLTTLSEIERKVVELHYFRDLKINKIAGILGYSESYISKLHKTAIKKLRKVIS